MKLFDDIQNLFCTPSADMLAIRELEEAKRNLLAAQSAREYAVAMCSRYETTIRRLTKYVRGEEE